MPSPRAITNLRHFTRKIVGVILLCSFPTFSQTSNTDVFAPIPEFQRPRFIERLNLLIEYQKTRQWAKQYDLLSSLMTRAEGKRDFVNRTQQAFSNGGRPLLLSFTPSKVTLVQIDDNGQVWFIAGCSEVSQKKQKLNISGVVEAYRENDDWFFSEVQILAKGKRIDPCDHTPTTGSSNSKPH